MGLDSDNIRLTSNVTSEGIVGGGSTQASDSSAIATAWLWLFVAICIEVCGTSCLKLSNGYKNVVPTVLFFFCYAMSLGLLPLALKHLPMNICYAVWAGTGTALTTIVSVAVFKEKISWGKILSIVGIIICLVLLNFV